MATQVSFLTKIFKTAVSFRTAAFGVGGVIALLGGLPADGFTQTSTSTKTPDTEVTSSKKVKANSGEVINAPVTPEQHKANHKAVVDALKAEAAEEAEEEKETEEAIDLTKKLAASKNLPNKSSDDEDEDENKKPLKSEDEAFDINAANAAMSTVGEETMPGDTGTSSPDQNSQATSNQIPQKKHGLSGFFSDSSVSEETSEAPEKQKQEAKPNTASFANNDEDEDDGVGIQKEVVPQAAFQSSNGSVAPPSLAGSNDTSASTAPTPVKNTNSEKQNIPGFNNEAVPDVFSDDNTSPDRRKDPVSNWLGEEDNSDKPDTKNAWLHSLIPTNNQDTSEASNNSNVIDWGSYETSGQAPVLALEAPLKPGQNGPLPLYRPEAIFLDPWGINSWLRKRGIAFTLDNQNEFAGAITPATKGYPNLKQGTGNAGGYGFETDIDWQQLAGIKGLQTHTLLVGRYGIPGSRSFGENLNNSSEIYGGAGNVAIHLAYTYAEESVLNNRLRIAAGRMPLMTFFGKNPLECTFMNNSFCGNLKPGNDVYTRASNPAANWAAKVVYYPTEHTYIQAGLYFPEEYTKNRSGFKFDGGRIHGQSFPIEFGWLPTWGAYKGHYKVGIVPDNSEHQEGLKFAPGSGTPLGSTWNPQYPLKRGRGSWGTWFVFDQVIAPHKTPANLAAGLVLMGGVWFNDPTYAERKYEFQIGLLDTGFWKARPLDSVGINFSYTDVSNWVRNYERAQIHHGMNPHNCRVPGTGISSSMRDGNNGYTCGVQTNAEVIEIMYKIHVSRGIYVSPDFQYFFNPGGQHNLHDAAMFGVKSHVQLF